MAIAFFDLDKTLLGINSGRLWLQRELAAGHVSVRQALQATGWLVQYNLGFSSLEDAVKRAIATLAGSRAQELRARTVELYEAEIRHGYRPGGRRALEAHRRAGDQCVLLTASSGYLSELVSAELALDGALCNRLEVDGAGLHTGRTVDEVCFGSGKLAHAQRFASAAGVPLSACHFYTDSYTDLPVLAAVGSPVAVNPDPRLWREAQKRRWPIVDWGAPSRG